MHFICKRQVGEYYLTNTIWSGCLGVFLAVFLSPPAQQILLRGPVACSVEIIVVTAHSLQGT